MRCLWVSGDVPHPASHGKFVYSAGLSEALAGAGVEVVGVGIAGNAQRSETAPETEVQWHAIAATRRGRLASVTSRLPSMAFATTTLRGAVRALLAGGRWDAVVVDHLEAGWVADLVPRDGPPIVYVAHNHESSVRAAVAEASEDRVDRRAALRLDAEKSRRLERRLVARAALVVAITDSDAARFAVDAPYATILVLTPGYRGPRLERRTIDEHTPHEVTIVTSLDWHVKQANLAAFVAVADPIFAEAGVTLSVAGAAPPELAKRIEETTRATTLLGRVDDLDHLFARARVGIVAEPLGGGFKLKVLDYVFNRVPIAALAGSIEGVPLRPGSDMLVESDAAALARAVVAVIDDDDRLNALQRSAFDRCRDSFDWATRGTQLAEALAATNRGEPQGGAGMRILVHDFSGHPFQMQLSRELARRGHEVLHVDCASYATGKGDLRARPDDTNLHVHSIDLGEPFDKYGARRRFAQEYSYGRRFARVAADYGPEVIVSSNDPLLAKWVAGRWCRRTKTPWVFWLQDIYSVAMSNAVRSIPVAGAPLGAGFRAIERRLLHEAAAVVPISADFLPLLAEWGVDRAKCTVIENWAPLEEMPVRPRRNPWSAAHGLDDAIVFLYAGTLGLKHDPELLVELARRFRDRPDVRVVVASEGVGADRVREAAAAEGLDNMLLLPFQSFDVFPDALATGDVLVVILEPDAGVFSVPSKVLSYHCAGRALLASVPAENLAARIVREHESGLVVQPGDRTMWIEAARSVLEDGEARTRFGANARRYAEQTFDIGAIADQFETVLRRVTVRPGRRQ